MPTLKAALALTLAAGAFVVLSELLRAAPLLTLAAVAVGCFVAGNVILDVMRADRA